MEALNYDNVSTPLGLIYITYFVKDGSNPSICLTAITFNKRDVFSQSNMSGAVPVKKRPLPEEVIKEIKEYFDGERKRFNLSCCLSGTDFENRVWRALEDIPYGETRTYKWIAEKAGSPKGERAAGQALSRNPLPIILPCHRVIQSDGKLGGYSSGIEIKRRLLELEYYNSQ